MKRITDYNIKYAPNEDIINILKTNHIIIVKGVNAQDKILNLLFNLKTVFTECFLLNYSKPIYGIIYLYKRGIYKIKR